MESYNSAAAKQTESYNAYASAASALETARNTEYLNAANSVSSYQSAYDAALTAEQEAGAALNNANTALSAAQAACDAAQAALDADSANPELQAARDNAAAALTAAQNTAAAAQSDYTAKSAARQAAEDALKTGRQTRLRRAVSGLCRGGPGLAAGQEHLRDGYGNPPAG
ncbi:MAG: hypothetical protein ACLS9Y_08735 [Ruthenibacterium lactatiformans]